MPAIQANGVQLYYEQHGWQQDRPVLVLSNGVLMSTASWALQTPVLSRHYRLLLYDCRGMWQSEHPAGPYSMEQHADDLAALLDALDVAQAHIGGISYGAEISLVFALRHPARTRSVVVASAVSHMDPLLRAMVASWAAAAQAQDAERLFQVTAPLNFSEPWLAANGPALAAARQRYQALDMAAFLELLGSFERLDITARLPEITAPALVMVGEHDILKPRRYAEIIARGLPHSEFAVLPHAGHAANWEQPGLFNALILGFLAQLAPQGARSKA